MLDPRTDKDVPPTLMLGLLPVLDVIPLSKLTEKVLGCPGGPERIVSTYHIKYKTNASQPSVPAYISRDVSSKKKPRKSEAMTGNALDGTVAGTVIRCGLAMLRAAITVAS